MLEIRIHGRGGQGVVTLAELLAKAAVRTGKEALTLPFFGVERRGAAVKAAVRLDDTPVKVRSQSYNPDILVLMNENLLAIGLADGIAENGIIIVSSENPLAVDRPQWVVGAVAIALNNHLVFGGEPFVNVPMLGALCRVLAIPFPAVEETLREQWREEKALPNIAAARTAYETVRKIAAKEAEYHV
jgi:2-oxoacid:acceptor oxidoreductase gamma subunit (pyruvate/2-ketoisovalerate family)